MSSPGTKSVRKKVTMTLVEASPDTAFVLFHLLQSEREETKDFCDLTIRHGDEEFVLHKCLFGTMPEYFDKLFSKISFGDKTLVLECGEKFGKLKSFLEKIYNGELNCNGEPNFTEMFGQEITTDFDKHAMEDSICENLNSDRLGLHKYCDVIISTGLRKFPVHKSILAIHSKYFSKVFSTDMKEKRTSICEVTTISDEVMALVLDFIYTKQMWVKDDQFVDLLAATDYLCMEDCLTEVLKWGVELVTNENCIQMWITGHQSQADLLINRAGDEICLCLALTQNFEKFLVDQTYFELLVNLIRGRMSNNQVLRYALTWVKQDIGGRKEMFGKVLDKIEIESLTHLGWTCFLNQQKLIINNATVVNAAISYMKNFLPLTDTDLSLGTMYVLCSENCFAFKIYKCDMSSLKPHPWDEETVFVPKWSCFAEGQFSLHNPILTVCNATLYIVDDDTVSSYVGGSWKTNLKGSRCFSGFGSSKSSEGFFNAAVASYNNTLYVAGGKLNQRELKNYHTESFPNQWCFLASMPNSRMSFALVPYKGFLFAIGQTNWIPHSMEVYSIRENSWSTTSTECPDLSEIKMKIIHKDKVYIVHEKKETRVATFDLAQRRWISGKSVETAMVARCAGLTLSVPGFRTCVMDFTNAAKKGGNSVIRD